jgi:dipeptidase D
MATLPSALDNLEPSAVWRHFGQFSLIPRPSGEEEGMRAYICGWATSSGFTFEVDSVGNLIVKVPGSGGGVGSAPVVLQGHMDMVCEKNSDKSHDFSNDPITLMREGNNITADGTTLGADNGIGVALAMAAADGAFGDHPPLELLFTMDEETGMTGARAVDAGMLDGRLMINIDAEEEGVLYVGCAGGQDTVVSKRFSREVANPDTVALKVAVLGLRGGHSGLDIIKNRGNAIQLLVEMLRHLNDIGKNSCLVELTGGSKRNAIPREASAVVRVLSSEVEAFGKSVLELEAKMVALHADSDSGLRFEVETIDDPRGALTDVRGLLSFLSIVPNGVVTMSQAVPGLVETSTNLGVVYFEGETVEVVLCSRSSNQSALDRVAGQISGLADVCGLDWVREGSYPGWQPDMTSGLLKITREVFAIDLGEEPEVTAIHAGLECGLLGDRVPGMEMISFGPNIRNAHSPDELVEISSVQVVGRQLGALLRALI